MIKLRELQKSFQNALRRRNVSIVQYITKPKNMNVADRLQVCYRDYYFRLLEALKDDYEISYKLMGKLHFEDLIKNYLDQYPSTTPTIREIGYQFPKYLYENNIDSTIFEMAQFECNMQKALFSPDADHLNMRALSAIKPEEWGNLQLQFHPSLHQLTCNYNTMDLWLALDKDENLASEKLNRPSEVILWRYKNQVFFRSLTKEETILLKEIEKGVVFSVLCEEMLDYYDEEVIVECVAGILQTWINDGIFLK